MQESHHLMEAFRLETLSDVAACRVPVCVGEWLANKYGSKTKAVRALILREIMAASPDSRRERRERGWMRTRAARLVSRIRKALRIGLEVGGGEIAGDHRIAVVQPISELLRLVVRREGRSR